MNEQVARQVVLVRAIETSDQQRQVLSDEDRAYASRSAKELAHWQAHDARSPVTADHFLQQRSEQILKRIGERHPAFVAFAQRSGGLTSMLALLPVLALLAGAGLDRIADPHRVDLLSAPLLLIIGWNLLAYALLLVLACVPSRIDGPITRAARKLTSAKPGIPRKLPAALAGALLSFAAEWTQLSAALTAARVRRAIHMAGALLAFGAALSLYARGMLAEYSAGWESTFLDASQVHALLSALFLPAMKLLGLQGFSLAEIETLRFGAAPPPSGGARWVHLYAATLLLLVIVPRALLAAFAHWKVKRLSRSFPLDLLQPYFRKLDEQFGGSPGTMRVIPYSYTVDEARDRGLHAFARALLGEQAGVILRPPAAYGEEPADSLRDIRLDDAGVSVTAILFNLAATPEKESHGAFIDYVARSGANGFTVLIDQSSFAERIGAQAGAQERIAERCALWREFCRFHHASATIVDLVHPQTAVQP